MVYYGKVAAPGNPDTVVEAARRGETAIGCRIAAMARDEAGPYGVVINPPKAAPVTFSDGDRVVVLAES